MRRKNDILLKGAFEEAFPDLLQFFFADADLIFDLDRGFEFMDKELLELFPELQAKGGSRFVDMLVKTHLLDGLEKWMLVHIEIQAKNDLNFGRRMFQYFYRIFDRYDVPISALAVFTGGNNQTCCSDFEYQFLGTSLTYRFNVYQIFDQSENELLEMNNPFALIVLAAQKAHSAHKTSDLQLGEQRLTIARAFVKQNQYDLERTRRFLFFLKTFLYIENSEINCKFDNEVSNLTGDKKVMGIIEAIKLVTREEALEEGLGKGIEKGIEEGIQKSRRTFVTNLLLNTKMDITEIASLADVKVSYVKGIMKDVKRPE